MIHIEGDWSWFSIIYHVLCCFHENRLKVLK